MSNCFLRFAYLYFPHFLETTYCFCNRKVGAGHCFRQAPCVCGVFPRSGPFCNPESLALSVWLTQSYVFRKLPLEEKNQPRSGIPLPEQTVSRAHDTALPASPVSELLASLPHHHSWSSSLCSKILYQEQTNQEIQNKIKICKVWQCSFNLCSSINNTHKPLPNLLSYSFNTLL